jgi:hypothetical protein
MDNGKILYFAYGANKTAEMMASITGNKNLTGRPAVLEGYGIFVQKLNQVPDVIAPHSPAKISPQQILRNVWDKNFESYVIKPAEERQVHGTVWELTPLERELVRNWELIDFGWYKDAEVKIKTDSGDEIEVQTEIMGDGQEVDREVDGLDYPPFLNELADFQRVAENTREEYLAMTLEGNTSSKESD